MGLSSAQKRSIEACKVNYPKDTNNGRLLYYTYYYLQTMTYYILLFICYNIIILVLL